MSALVLKLLAALAMLCDHTAITLYPLWLGKGAYMVLRGIGRIAFPIFAYFITVGYEKTSSLPRYLTRLCTLALLSQIPYSLVFVSGVYSTNGPTAFSFALPWPVVLLLIVFVAAVWLFTVRRDLSVLSPLLALFAGLRLPLPLETAAQQIAQTASPMLLFLLGAFLELEGLRRDRRAVLFISLIRLLLIPAATLIPAVFLGFRGVALASLLPVFASSTAVNSFTMAQQMGGDAELAGNIVVATSALCSLTLFFWCFLLKSLGLF